MPAVSPEFHVERKRAIMAFIKRHIAEKGYSPNSTQIAVEIGLQPGSHVRAWKYVEELIHEGYLQRPVPRHSILVVLKDYPEN